MRYLATIQAAERLEELAYLERACAHILAGWIARTPEMKVKIQWGQQFAASMEQAARLGERARALRAGEDVEACVAVRWRDAARRVDEAADTTGVLRGLGRLQAGLALLYADYLERADPVADAGSIALVTAGGKSARAQFERLRKQVGADGARGSWPTRQKSGEQISLDQAIWAPLDRVPRVARPDWMKRGEPGALRLLPLRPRSHKDTGLFLHNFLNEEFTTLELVARNSYEHPEMPRAFHRDAARHAGDEARHAQLFVRALPDYGLRYGDYPIYTYSYEGEYEFPENQEGTQGSCAPGSMRELLWRLILRQVVHEGLALDSTAFEVRKRTYFKQPELARVFGYTLADEVFHAGAGLKWSRYLVNGDEGALRREWEMAYSYYAARLKERRLTWGATHLEQAAAEAEQLEELARQNQFPFHVEVNVAARRRAGFSEAEIRAIEDGG